MKIANGIYPTMLVAYKNDGEIDYPAMGELIEWYIEEVLFPIFTGYNVRTSSN
jgi:dihydrodipicolinate synthase/N-acetylneuraminate lyase